MKRFLMASVSAFAVAACCGLSMADERNAEGFKKLDADSDGKVTLAEFSKDAADKDAAAAEFKALDKDADDSLTEAEYTAA